MLKVNDVDLVNSYFLGRNIDGETQLAWENIRKELEVILKTPTNSARDAITPLMGLVDKWNQV